MPAIFAETYKLLFPFDQSPRLAGTVNGRTKKVFDGEFPFDQSPRLAGTSTGTTNTLIASRFHSIKVPD